MKLREFLEAADRQISPISHTPRQDLYDFLEIVTGVERERLITEPEMRLGEQQLHRLNAMLARQIQGEPHALVAGFSEFFGRRIYLAHKVLIPRPETEQLVELLLANLPTKPQVKILEIGTGSGCIITTLAAELSSRRQGFQLIGIDPSNEAIANTQLNLDWTAETESSADPQTEIIELHQYSVEELEAIPELDIIISNPPYLTEAEMQELDNSVSEFEPHSALLGGADGLDIYRQISSYIKKLDKAPQLFLEISPTITPHIRSTFAEHYGENQEIQNDLFGRERFLVCG